jgi:hypothetical protein
MGWFYVYLGLSGTGPYYAFWSGFGSDIGEFAIVIALLKTVNCHEKGCWKLGLLYKGHVVCHQHRENIGASDGH